MRGVIGLLTAVSSHLRSADITCLWHVGWTAWKPEGLCKQSDHSDASQQLSGLPWQPRRRAATVGSAVQ